MNISVDVSPEDIVYGGNSHKELKELIINIDQEMADWDFTEGLAIYFIQQMKILHKELLEDSCNNDMKVEPNFSDFLINLSNKELK